MTTVHKIIGAVKALSILMVLILSSNSLSSATLTLPSQPASITTDDYSALLSSGGNYHIQDAYGSSYFTNGPVTIYEVRFQRRLGSAPFTNASVTLSIAMSTSTKATDTLDATFANNVGTDQLTVFNGTISLTSTAPQNFEPHTSPYDIVIPLTTPFNYDPAKGSLLVDFRQSGGGIPTAIMTFNLSTDKASRVVGYSSNATSGAPDTGSESIQLVILPTDNSDVAFNPPSGTFTNSTQITIYSRLSSGVVRYTIDGSDPVVSSPQYASPLTISTSATVKARYFVNGFPASDIFSASYTKADPILFSPGSTLFTNSLAITLANTLGSGVIRYTLDGSSPTATSPAYTGPILLTNRTTISAQLYLNNFSISSVYATNYARVYAFGSDGISIAWRQQYFGPNYSTDPRAEASADPDADGSTNLQEFNAGTNPLDANSGFRIAVRAVPLLSWPTQVNSNYNILRRTSLASGNFTLIATVKATSTTTTYVDTEAGGATSQDYYTIQIAP